MGQSIFFNAVFAAASRILVLGLGLGVTALTVRIISVEQFGIYSFVLTIGTFLQLAADFGLYLTASRELGANLRRPAKAMRHIVSLRGVLLLAVFAFGIGVFFAVPSMRQLAALLFLIALGLIAQSGSQLLMGVFQAYGTIWKATVGEIIGRVVQVGILGYLWLHRAEDGAASLSGIAIAFSAGLLVALIIHGILAPHRGALLPKVSIPAWKRIISISWPIALMLILNVIYFRVDILILSMFRPDQEVGWYSLAYKIIENGLFFPAMLGGLLLPHITSAITSADTKRANDLVSQGLLLSFYIAIIAVMILVIFADPLIAFIGGSGFEPSGPLLRVLSLALAIMFFGNIFGFALIALEKQRTLAVLYGVLVLGNIILNIMYIPRYGAIAASWVTVITEAAAMLFAAYVVHRHLQWKIDGMRMILALLCAGVAVYVGFILPEGVHVAWRIACVGILYGWMGYVFGLWNKTTLMALRQSPIV